MRHYTYALIDPRTLGAPFYIGKGSAARRFAHFKSHPVDKRSNPAKMQIIKQIEKAGLKPQAVVLGWFDNEQDAYADEQKQIEQYGIDNLTNKNSGGSGGHVKAGGSKETNALTAKEEQFCCCVASGMSQYKSYKAAFNVRKTTKRATVDSNASHLMARTKITTRIAEIRAPSAKAAEYTFDGQLGKLDQAFETAKRTDQAGAMTGAAKEQSKMLDLYPSEKLDITVREDDIVERLHKGRQRNADRRKAK